MAGAGGRGRRRRPAGRRLTVGGEACGESSRRSRLPICPSTSSRRRRSLWRILPPPITPGSGGVFRRRTLAGPVQRGVGAAGCRPRRIRGGDAPRRPSGGRRTARSRIGGGAGRDSGTRIVRVGGSAGAEGRRRGTTSPPGREAPRPGALVRAPGGPRKFRVGELPTRPQGRAAKIGGQGDARRRPAGRAEAQGRAAGGCRCPPGTKAWGRRSASTAGDGTRPPIGRRSAASGASCWICGTGWTAGTESPERMHRRAATTTESADGGNARHRPDRPGASDGGRPRAGRAPSRNRPAGIAGIDRQASQGPDRRASQASTGRHRRAPTGRHRRARQAGIAGSGRLPAGHYPDSRKRERPRTDYG